MSFRVEFSPAAAEDLEQLFDHALERELNSATGDLSIPTRALQAIEDAIGMLRASAFTCRKAAGGANPFLRELVIPFGRSGYVALFEIVGSDRVIIGSVRHQREDDYH